MTERVWGTCGANKGVKGQRIKSGIFREKEVREEGRGKLSGDQIGGPTWAVGVKPVIQGVLEASQNFCRALNG